MQTPPPQDLVHKGQSRDPPACSSDPSESGPVLMKRERYVFEEPQTVISEEGSKLKLQGFETDGEKKIEKYCF